MPPVITLDELRATNARRKLTDQDAQDVRRLYFGPQAASKAELSKCYSVSSTHIVGILRRVTYRHLPLVEGEGTREA